MTHLFSLVLLALPLLAQVADPPAAKKAESGTAVLAGTVLDRVSRTPIRKALVRLTGEYGAGVHVMTDAAGRFVVRDLGAGSYRVQVEHPNYPAGAGYLLRERTRRVRIEDGEKKTDLEFLLTPGASVSGRVVDEDGEPVMWSQVDLLRFAIKNGARRMQLARSAQTDDRGEYRIHGVAPGRYFVRVLSQRRLPLARPFAPPDAVVPAAPEAYPMLFYPGATTLVAAGKVALRPGMETSGIDFELPRIPAVDVRGRVTAPDDGWATREYSVSLVARDELLGAKAPTFGTRLHKRSGRFRFTQPIPPGSYWLDINGDGGDRQYTAHQAVDIQAGPLVELTVPLTPSSPVRGRVEGGASGSERVKVVRIELLPADGAVRWYDLTAKPADDGTFVIDNVPPGRWRLLANLNGLGYVKTVRAGAQEVDRDDLVIPAGGGPELLVEVGTLWARLSGPVDSKGGWVCLLPASEKRRWLTMLQETTAEDGFFSFDRLEPGDYRLFAIPAGVTEFPEGLVSDPDVLEAVLSRAASVTLKAGGEVTAAAPLIPVEVLARRPFP